MHVGPDSLRSRRLTQTKLGQPGEDHTGGEEPTEAPSKQPCEEWRPVAGFEGYEVSNWGRMRSWRIRGPGTALRAEPILLKPTRATNGYRVVTLYADDGRRCQLRIHVLVLLAFVGPRPPGAQGRHYNERDKGNNAVGNLRWGTAFDNARDRVRHGMAPRGAAVNTAKMTPEKVRDIRSRPASESHASLAREFGLSVNGMRNIRIGKAWAHV